MTEQQQRICLRAIDHFGIRHQKKKLIEEMGELQTEICREQDARTNIEKVREELADVIIMCQQMRLIYGAADVDRWIEKKTAYLLDLIRKPKRAPRLPKMSLPELWSSLEKYWRTF
jgi:NTP pyrophosphatase (non-canonical NTP hydrolase)